MQTIALRWLPAIFLPTTVLLAFAASAATVGNDIGRAETLLLNVTINTKWMPRVIRAERLADGRLALELSAWNEIHLRLPDQEPLLLQDNQRGYALEAVTGLTYQLDHGQMALTVTAPASAFIGSEIDHRNVAAPLPDRVRPGFYLDYDLSASRDERGYDRQGALLEGTAFGSWGSAVTGLVFTGHRLSGEIVRTESYWRKDLPGAMETLVLGDTISDGGAWSRPARYAGIRWARDFSLRPGFIAMPMPTLTGTAALPSTIDVMINNQRRATEQVDPGPFELTNVPVTNGSGDIHLIVRDLLGRESIISQSFYSSPRLLAQGLSDFSVEAGFLRENYGRQSSDYGDAFVAGTRRYGLTPALTGETHLEIQAERQAIGFDVVALFGNLATVEASVATASTDHLRGNHYLFGLERRTPRSNGSVLWEYFEHDFVQFAAVPDETRPRQRLSASVGTLLPRNASVALNYTSQTSWDTDRLDLLTLNLAVTLPRGAYLGGYVTQDLGREHAWSAGVTFILSLGEQRTASASTSLGSNGKTVNRADLSQSPPGGPGYGWRLGVSDEPNQRWHGGLTRNTTRGSFSAEASGTTNSTAIRLGANGSVGWLGGHVFSAPSIGAGSFAVVKVDGIEGVPIYRSNQLTAITNRSGMALVPGLLPYQANQLTIDPVELPFDTEIQGVKQIAVPYARSGLLVDFSVHRSRNALVILRQVDGSVVPAGSRVTVSPGESDFLVGKRGEAYLMNLSDSNRLSVQWQDGSCQFMLPLEADGPSEPRLGPLTCGEQP